ncbi:MAG: aminotransferase class V-fold PLP-dependent enzyme [Terriglobales bacterium]
MKKFANKAPCAIILAAGEGRSLFPLTKDRPKALLSVGGEAILERLLRQLRQLGVSDFVVVVGYKKDKVVELTSRFQRHSGATVHLVENERYAETNTLYSLSLAGSQCGGRPILLIDGDIVCEEEILVRFLQEKGGAVLAVDTARLMGQEEMKVRFGQNQILSAIGKNLSKPSAEFLGISKFSGAQASELFRVARKILSQGDATSFYEEAFCVLCDRERAVRVLDISGLKWEEIDFLTDYEEALRVFGLIDELRSYRASRQSLPQYLFCPGPVLVSDKVKEALASSEIGHRELEFSELLNRVRMKLARVFGVQNFHHYTTVVITGSGSAANESVLGSAGTGKRLLVISNGEFGERWTELAEFLDLAPETIKLRWGQPFPIDQIQRHLKRGKTDVVCMVHHETSTGMLNPLGEVAALAKRFGVELFVDAVSSVGAVPIDIENSGITFCTGSANKAIASVPGLSFVCGKRAAFDALKTARPHSFYLDLYKHFVFNERKFQTPNTPAVNLFFALEASLDGILEPGLESTFERYRSLAVQLRTGMKELGFRFFIPEEYMSPVLTTVELPAGFEADEFHERLKQRGFVTYPGKGILRHRVFQVANIGEISSHQAREFLKALKQVIQ